MSQVKAIGNVIKYTLIDPPDVEIDGFFREAVEGEWLLADILDAWHELEAFKNVILLPIDNYKSQFATMNDVQRYIHEIPAEGKIHELVFLAQSDILELPDLKNTEELSGMGKLLVPFNLQFENFGRKFTPKNDQRFFTLEPNQVILNSVRLIIDDNQDDGTVGGLKLTGKAAEIAARKARNEN